MIAMPLRIFRLYALLRQCLLIAPRLVMDRGEFVVLGKFFLELPPNSPSGLSFLRQVHVSAHLLKRVLHVLPLARLTTSYVMLNVSSLR
jgi:hypothetical protein